MWDVNFLVLGTLFYRTILLFFCERVTLTETLNPCSLTLKIIRVAVYRWCHTVILNPCASQCSVNLARVKVHSKFLSDDPATTTFRNRQKCSHDPVCKISAFSTSFKCSPCWSPWQKKTFKISYLLIWSTGSTSARSAQI